MSFALLAACSSGDLQATRLIIENLRPDLTRGSEPLRQAVKGGHVAVARYLLQNGMWIRDTPLACVELDGAVFEEMVKLFVEFGWDVDKEFEDGTVLLPLNVRDEAKVRLLLSLGACPDAGQPVGAALNAAASQSTTTIFDLLLSYGAKLENSQALHAAAESDTDDMERIPMMKYLVESGLDLNELKPTPSGITLDTPLHRAVRAQKVMRASWLVEIGADPMKKDIGEFEGTSALELAVKLGLGDFVGLCQGFT